MRTFNSAMAIHIKLKPLAIGTWPLANALCAPVGAWKGQCQLLSATYRRPEMNLNGIKLTWLGHATFRLETPAGKNIIVDPWIMGNPACPAKEKDLKKVDVMLCTHGHFDHIGDAVEIGRKHKPVVVAIPELAHWLGKKGVKQVAEMNKGGTQTVGDVKVTMVHADHSCGITAVSYTHLRAHET